MSKRSDKSTRQIVPTDLGRRTPELDLALWFDQATRTYHSLPDKR